jgi:hypothetical protein
VTATVTRLQPRPQRIRVYLAGPMRGRVGYNFHAFEAGAAELRQLNYDVISPAEHDLELGFDPALDVDQQEFDLRAALLWDLQQVLAADGVVTLAGWAHSTGALAEVATARAAGIPVFELAEILDGQTQVAA